MRIGSAIEKNITCPLCHGYLIDAVTLKECTHFFCRRCFLLHLQKEQTCPACSTQLTDLKTAFFRDQTLQNLVYKLTPSTYWREVQLRADFIEKRVVTAEERRQIADLNLIQFQQHLCDKDELISFCLAYVTPEQLIRGNFDEEQPPPSPSSDPNGHYFKKYFRCKAAVLLADIKTILAGKFELPEKVVIVFVHEGSREILEDKYTLQDIVYLFGWTRDSPMRISFTAMETQAPASEDEEAPPVLEKECFFDQRDESMKSPPPSEEPEKRVSMIPALTVNLSTAQCIPDMTLNGGTGTRIPIITEAAPPSPKKRRRNGPRKEKAAKIDSQLPIAPNSNNALTPGGKIQLANGQEWIVGSPINLGSPPASIISPMINPNAATTASMMPPASSPASSTSTPPMVAPTAIPALSVPASSRPSPSMPIFAKPAPQLSVASMLSPSVTISSKPGPSMPNLIKPTASTSAAAMPTLSIPTSSKPSSSIFPPMAKSPMMAYMHVNQALPGPSRSNPSMPTLSKLTPPMPPLSKQSQSMPMLSKPGSSQPNPAMPLLSMPGSSKELMSSLMQSMSGSSKQSIPSMSQKKFAMPPSLLPMTSTPMSSVLITPQSMSTLPVYTMSGASKPSTSSVEPQETLTPPPKRNGLMPRFTMPPMSSKQASSVTITPKTSTSLTEPVVSMLQSSKPMSFKMLPTMAETETQPKAQPYPKQSPRRTPKAISKYPSTVEVDAPKEKSSTRSITEAPSRPFVMPRSVSPDYSSRFVKTDKPVPIGLPARGPNAKKPAATPTATTPTTTAKNPSNNTMKTSTPTATKNSTTSTTNRSPNRQSPTKQSPHTASVNKVCSLLAGPRTSPSKNIGSSIIPIMTDRVPLLTASKAGR